MHLVFRFLRAYDFVLQDMECHTSMHLELTYKKYFIEASAEWSRAYNVRKKVKRRILVYICCSISRCIADLLHYICCPFAFGSFGITTLILVGVKLNDSAALGWWTVLLPLQVTFMLSFILFVKTVLCYSLSLNDPVAQEYAEIETRLTPCGDCLDTLNYEDCWSSATQTLAIGSFIASFLSLIVFVILLSLKLEIGLDVLWSSVLIPLEIAIVVMPTARIVSGRGIGDILGFIQVSYIVSLTFTCRH